MTRPCAGFQHFSCRHRSPDQCVPHCARVRGRERLFASWESSRAMDGPKRRRPDSNLAMDGEVRLSEQALPPVEPLEATVPAGQACSQRM